MKRVIALVALGLMMTAVVSSCKHHKPCESYGNKSGHVEHSNSDELPS